MTKTRDGHSCQEYKGELVVMGGEGKTVEILNLTSIEWRRGPDLPRRVSWGLSTVYEDTLYLIDSGWDATGNVYRLSQDSAQWTVVANVGIIHPTRQVFPAPTVTSDIIGCGQV